MSALNAIRQTVAAPEAELKRWRRTFEGNAKTDVNGQKFAGYLSHVLAGPDNLSNRFLDKESFVNAIAPKGDPDKIDRAQYAILFRVADSSRRGVVSWDDFCVFETMLKRPDADYWMAFQYFDV